MAFLTLDDEALQSRCQSAGIAEIVIDTTAAGDSFSAGYIAARLRGDTVIASAQQAHRLASRVIQYPGAIVPLTAMPE